MNYTFDTTRFCRLFAKHSREHYKKYLMSLAVLIGVMMLGGGFVVYMVDIPVDRSFQSAMFLIILLLAGTFFTSTIFADIGDRKKAVASLMLPASHLEKYMVAWLYSFVLFAVVYTICFVVVALAAINMQHQANGHSPELINIFDNQVVQMYLLYAFLHAVAFYGAIYFEKLHFIKTAFVFFISIAILIILNKFVLHIMVGRTVDATPPFGSLRFLDNGDFNEIGVGQKFSVPYALYAVAGTAPLLWAAAYYRLKEKQV